MRPLSLLLDKNFYSNLIQNYKFHDFSGLFKYPESNKGIWLEHDEWLVRTDSNPLAWTMVFPKNKMIDAFLYYYGLNDHFEERMQAAKTFEIKYYRKLI